MDKSYAEIKELLTCDKSDWYNKNTKKWNPEKVKDFWENVRQYIHLEQQGDRGQYYPYIEFTDVIFPVFEEDEIDEDFDGTPLYMPDNKNFLTYSMDKIKIDEYLSFKNCIFLDDIDFSHYEPCEYNGLRFDNCTFEKNCDFSYGITIKSLVFNGNKETTKKPTITIVGSTIKSFKCEEVHIEQLNIENLRQLQSFKITNAKIQKTLIINNNWTNSEISIDLKQCNSVEVNNNIFNNSPMFFELLLNTSNNIHFSFENNTFSTLQINNGVYDLINFKQCYFNELSLVATNSEKINFEESCTFQDKASIIISYAKKLYIYDSFINGSFYLDGINSTNDEISIYNCVLDKDAIVDFNNAIFNTMRINKLINLSLNVSLNSIKIVNLLQFINTDFKNANFNNLNLSKCKFQFEDVSLHKIEYNNINWGWIKPTRFIFENETFGVRRSLFSQLKNAHDQLGNNIDANKFYAIEMQEAQEELKSIQTEEGNNLTPKKQDYIVLLLHKIFSNYSQSIALPFFWLFIFSTTFASLQNYIFVSDHLCYLIYPIFTIVFFLLVLIDDNARESVVSSWIAKLILSILFLLFFSSITISLYPSTISLNESYMIIKRILYPFDLIAKEINPAKMLSVNEDKSAFLFMIGKVIYAFLIYQLILAFRQNTRRK